MYDVTAGNVETPLGMGKFVEYIPHRGVVVVAIDNRLVEFDGREVYICEEEGVRN